MSRNRLTQCLVVALWSGSFGLHGAAAQPSPLGPETRVDTLEGRQPREPLLAVQPGGGFEIAWGYLSVTAPFVAARHFDADGSPTDAAQVPLGGPGTFTRVRAVTALPQGFEVLWQVGLWPYEQHFRRHLNLAGTPDPGKPVPLNKKGLSTRWVWQVRGNGFLGGWPVLKDRMNVGLGVRHLSPSGSLTGPVLRLNSRPVSVDERPILTAVAGGGFLAVWNGAVAKENNYLSALRARVFTPAGKPLGPDFDVSTALLGVGDVLHSPKVASAPGGGFALAWRLFDTSVSESAATPYLRFFDAAGRPRGPEIPGELTEWVESMAFDDAGNLLVLWSNDLTRITGDLRIQLFDPDGEPLGPPAHVASEASGAFTRPLQGNVAWAGDSWIVTWTAETNLGLSGPYAIFVRRFAG